MNTVKKLLSHPLVKGSTIILVGSNLGSAINYIFNLAVGRFFVPSEYGTYAALITLLGLFGIFPSTFITVFAKFSAMYKAREDTQNANALFTIGFKIIAIFASIVLVTLCFSVFYISSLLNITDIRLFILVFIIIFLSIISSVPAGILQGEMRLYTLSISSIITPFLKVLIGLFTLFLGLKILGVTVAILISSLITFIFLLSKFTVALTKKQKLIKDQTKFLHEFKRYSLQVFFSLLGMTILASTDILFVKHFFSAEKAGQFGALSLMGKSIFYLTSPIYFVFFPLIAQKKERDENVYNTLFLAVSIIALCSVALSFVYFLFPTIILDIFFPSQEWRILTSYLGPYSLYIIIFSIAMLFNNFLLSIGKSEIYKINLLIAFFFIFLMYIFHETFYQIIIVLFVTSFLLLASHLLYYISTIYAEKQKTSIHNNSCV